MKVFFLDTNVFLQCRDLPVLPWNDVASGDSELLLLIPEAVRREIDSLKQDGNHRRAKRARLATSFIRKILNEKNLKLTIKELGPRVEVSFALSDPSLDCTPASLNLSRADDHIVAEALSYKASNPTAEILVFTGDTNLTLTAKLHHVHVMEIPDAWLLPPESDPRDKRIAELEQRLRQLEKTYPEIEIVARYGDGSPVPESLPISVTKYEQLSVSEIEELIGMIGTDYPLLTRSQILDNSDENSQFVPSMFRFEYDFEPPDDQEIQKYCEAYEQWVANVEHFLRVLPEQLESQSRNIGLLVRIGNAGSVPAENLVLEFRLVRGLLFRPVPEITDESGCFPSPPRVPEGRWIRKKHYALGNPIFLNPRDIKPITAAPDTKLLPSMIARPKRDKHAFYWKHSEPSDFADLWEFECDEFRHQVNPENFEMVIHVPQAVEVEKSVLMCQVTARNLPKPVIYPIPIRVSAKRGDIVAEARKLSGIRFED